MNIVDIILIVLIAAAFLAAVTVCIRSKKDGRGCGGNCSGCIGCRYKKDDDTKGRR